METLGKIAKAMIERGSNVNIENLMNVLDREKVQFTRDYTG